MEFNELQQIVESNSRAIQAMLDAQATSRLEHEEFKERTDATINRLDTTITRLDDAIQRIITLNEGVVNMLGSLDEDRPTVLRKLNSIENKVDQLWERTNEDGEET